VHRFFKPGLAGAQPKDPRRRKLAEPRMRLRALSSCLYKQRVLMSPKEEADVTVSSPNGHDVADDGDEITESRETPWLGNMQRQIILGRYINEAHH
jgi:hypothetical protein